MPSPQPAGADSLVVEFKDQKLTLAELDALAQASLRDVRQKEYEARRAVLDQWVTDRLLKREAAARKLSVEDLSRQEIQDKVKSPTNEEVAAFYESVKAQVQGQPLEALRVRIEAHLRQQGHQRRTVEFRRELLRQHDVKLRLQPPRFDVQVAAGAPSLGPAAARVKIVEYTDIQCPYCRVAQETLERVLKTYGDRVLFIHRDFPLENHAQAGPAARAAYCAGDQSKFWEYRRNLLMEPGDLGEADLKRRADQMGLEAKAFGACLASNRHADVVQAAAEEGRRAGISATPTFFINGRLVSGALPYDGFVDIIEEELALAAS